MNYDPALWEDATKYGSSDAYQTNYLQAIALATCKIGIQGPTEFPISPSQPVQVGKLQFLLFLIEDPSGINTAIYIENKSLTGYSYDPGLPIPVISANQNEWVQCKEMGEKVLSTLRVP